MKLQKTMPKLENWKIVKHAPSLYTAPELMTPTLVGNVYNHEKHSDGKMVQTSNLVALNIQQRIGVTKNTVYDLGKVDEKWLRWITENGYNLNDYSFNGQDK